MYMDSNFYTAVFIAIFWLCFFGVIIYAISQDVEIKQPPPCLDASTQMTVITPNCTQPNIST